MYIDSGASLPLPELGNRNFLPIISYKFGRSLTPVQVTYVYYLKIRLFNDEDTSSRLFIFPGTLFREISLYDPDHDYQLINEPEREEGYQSITLAPHTNRTLIVKLRPAKYENDKFNIRLIRENFITEYRTLMENSRPDLLTFGYVISGVLLMMVLFMITNFFIHFKREFLLNAIYSFCMFLLVFLNSYLLMASTRFASFFMSYFDLFLLITGTVFYILFTRRFLDTRNEYPVLDRILRYTQFFMLASMLVYTLLNFFSNLYPVQSWLEVGMKFISLIMGGYFIVLALKQKNRLLNYIAAGNAALVLFSTISLLIIISTKKSATLFTSSLFYYNLGITFELVFFLLGLTYKNRNELIEKTREQEALKLYAEKKEFETQLAIMKAQQEERNRISADMHDDLGAGMTTIRLYSELARTKLGNHSIPEIDKISSSSDELLNKMNAIIWSMSSSNDSLGNMIAYIRSYALEYLEGTGIECHVSIPDKLPDIEVIGEIRRNVFLVVKESLNNLVKHSQATDVWICLEKVPGGLTLFIQDNGIGIVPDKLRQFGNGLKNMKKRMADVNIEFSIENNNGTLIKLHRKIPGF